MKSKIVTIVAVLLTIVMGLGTVQFNGSQTAANAVVQALDAAYSGQAGSAIFLSTSGNEMIFTAAVNNQVSAVVLCLTRCNSQSVYSAWLAAGASLEGWLQIAPSQIPMAFKAVLGIRTFSVLMNTIRVRGMSLAMRMANTPYLVFILPVQLLEQPNLQPVAQ